MASWVLKAMGLACQKAHRTLFDGVSFSVAPGQWLHIEGGNGCGKTSLLRILCGLSPATKGQVLWSNPFNSSSPDDPMTRPDRNVLHYIGHALGLKADLSACENLRMDAHISGLQITQTQALQALEAQGLKSRAHLPVRVLSQGQRQGVALARLRTRAAPVWVLDEPLVGLDAQATAATRDFMQTHLQQGGAIVLTSHQDIQLQGPGASYRLDGGAPSSKKAA